MANKDYTIAALLILVGILLILLSVGFRIDFDNWRNVLPRLGDLATSPATRELTKEENTNTDVLPDNQKNEESAIGREREQEQEQEQENTPIVAAVPREPSTAPDSERMDMIIIPSINVSAPIITAQTYDAIELKALLDDGAVIYPSSPGFGNMGQTILMGHSAPPNWPEIKHDTIFSRTAELAEGDKIIAVYNDKTYIYSVEHSEIIEKGGDIPALANADSALVLVTCWPPGRNLKRIIVQSSLVSAE